MTSRRIPTLRRQALALEPRFLLDAAAVTTAVDVAAQAAPPTDAAPGVEATPTEATVVVTDSSDSFAPVDLFSGVTVQTDTGAADELSQLVVTVDRSGSDQALVIDGKTIALEGGSGTTRTDADGNADGYFYTVSVSGDTTTVTIQLDAFQPEPASVQALIDGMSYQILDKSVDGGKVSVTLKSLTDAGGQSADLSAITATIDIDSRINVAPVLTGDLMQEAEYFGTGSLAGATEVAYSADGKFVYAAGNDSTLSVFSVDAASGLLSKSQEITAADLGTVNHLVVSADGKSLYTISSNGNLMQWNVEADGALRHAATLSVGQGSTGGLAISDDGAQVYVDASNNFGREALAFSRDAATGALTQIQRLDAVRNASIATAGGYVTVIHSAALSGESHTLKLYARGADGTLSLVDSVLLDQTGQAAVDYAISMSADGKLLFVGQPGAQNISVFTLGADNLLTRAGTVASDNIGSLALNADDTLLYAATTDGTVSVYAVAANGGLTLIGSAQGQTSGADLALSGDGTSLVVAGNGLSRYTTIQSLTLGQDTVLGDRVNLSDPNYDLLDNGAGNYRGASVSITASVPGGEFGFEDGNGLSMSNGVISRGGVQIATYAVNGDTLTVRFVGDTATAVANQVLQQISYGNSGVAAGTFITLTVQANDGALDSDALAITFRSNTGPQIDPGVATDYAPAPVTTESAYSAILPEDLFRDADGDALTWRVTGLPAGLAFDPDTRTISGNTVAAGRHPISITVTDAYGASVTLNLDLVVAQTDNRAPVVSASAPASFGQVTIGASDFSASLRADMFSDLDSRYGDTLTWSIVDTLPAGLVFDAATRTLSGTPGVVGDYVLTVRVTDAGGLTADHTMTLRVVTAAEAANQPPAFDVDGSDLTYTADGRINGYGDYVYSVEVSDDGHTVIVLGNATGGHTVSPTGNSTLSVYTRNPNTGELTLVQRFVQGAANDGIEANGIEIDGLGSAASAVYSADDKHVYLVGQKEGGGSYFLTGFNVGADGTLAPTGQSVALGEVQVKQIAVSQDGRLYAVAGNTLYAYGIGSDGQLASAGVYESQPFSTASTLAVDAQGRVFVAGANTLTIYAANPDGSLTQLVARTGDIGNFARSIAVSGDTIYVSTGTTGVLTLRLDPATNTVTKVSATGSQLWGLALSADGKTLYAGGLVGTINVYSIGADGAPTLVKTIAQDASAGSYRAFRFGLSPDGTSMYVGGFYNAGGLGHIDVENAIQGNYAEGQTLQPAAGLNFSDADYDALAAGAGDYNGASITLVREGGANPGDVYGFADGNGLTLVGAEIRLNGAKIADFTSAGGLLTIAFTGQVSTATANAVLQQVTYTHASKDPGAAIRLQVQVRDQYASGVDSIVLDLAVAQVNDAPVVDATPVNATYDPAEAAIGLFDGTTISTVEAGQTIDGLTLVVSPVADGASETLTIDGVAIPLAAGQGVTASGHAYTVTLDNGTATVTITPAAGMTGAQAAALIDGIAYANRASSPTMGERSIALTAVRDSGGTDNGGQDTAEPDLVARLVLRNEAPVLVTPTDSLGLDELITQLGEDGAFGALDGVLAVSEVEGTLYVLRTTTQTDWNTFQEVELNTLYVLERNADGSLRVLQTIENGDVGALAGAATLRVSADGKSLYVIGSQGVALFSRDAGTGALTAQGSFGADLVNDYGMIRDVLSANGMVYATAGENLLVFRQDGSSLTLVSTLTDAGDTGLQLDGANALALSADGRFLFVGTSGGGTLASVFAVEQTGVPTFIMAAPGKDPTAAEQYYYTQSLTVSPDGKTLYVVDFDGNDTRLHTLSVAADGQLTALATTLPQGDVRQVVVSPDGSAVFVIGADAIGVYRRGADGVPVRVGEVTGYGDPFGDGISFGDIRSATLSEDGTKLYLAGQFPFWDGLLVLDLEPASVPYTEGSEPVAILPSATLADPQLDALDNGQGDYQGASITVARADGAHADDRYGFIDGGNLRLDAANGLILLNGAAVATFTQADGVLTLTFTASLSKADAQDVLRRIAYRNASNDPTRDGASIVLRTELHDGDGHRDELLTRIDLEGVNNPPEIDTTPLDPTFQAEGEPVKLFDGTTVDTIESGDNVARVIVTISPANAQDVLGVGGGRIPLNADSNGPQTLPTGQQYMVTIADGVTTVTLYLNASSDRAAQVIDSLTYANTGSPLDGTRTISLTVQEGNIDNGSTDADKVATVTLTGPASPNTPPTLTGGEDVPYTERADAVLIAPGGVVADAQMDAFNGGAGNYDGSVLTITLGAGKSAADTLGFQPDNGLTLENGVLKKDGVAIGAVSQADGVLTIRFSSAAGSIPTTADVQNTLRQITYANGSHAPAASLAISVTLADQRGLPSTTMDFSIDITAINDAPVVDADPVLSLGDLTHVQDLTTIPGLETPTASVVSADGTRVYVADGKGAIAVFDRDGDTGSLTYLRTFAAADNLAGVKELVTSADGKSLYALRADGNAIGVFGVAADGTLTHQATITSNYELDGGSLYDLKSIALSEDGQNLYLLNNYGIVYFNRDAQTGALAYVGAVSGDMYAEPFLWQPTDMAVRGDLLFVVTNTSAGSTLIVYRRDDSGALSVLTHIQGGGTDAAGQTVSFSNLQHIAVSADGSTLFVSNSRTSSYDGWTGQTVVQENPQAIDAFRLNAATGALTHLGTLSGDQTVEGIALSDDGKALFVTLADGTLNYYATASLGLIASHSLDGPTGIALSADGAVIVVGNGLDVLNAPPAPPPVYVTDGEPVPLAPTLALSDAEMDAADNYQDASVTFTGQPGDVYGILAGEGYTRDGDVILFNGQPIATLTQADGVATLRFTAQISRADANALLHRVTYAGADGAPGTRTITLVLNDGEAASAAYAVDVTLALPNQAPEAGTGAYTPDPAMTGRDYSVTLPETLFNDPDGDALQWRVSGLPAGLVFDPATRTISGTIADTGRFTIVITVTDPQGATASRELVLEAVEPPNTAPVDSGIPLAPDAARIGEPYAYTLPAGLFTDADGDALTWQVTGLPDGLVFDPATLTIRGTATSAGSVAVVVSATDASGARVSRIVTLTVTAAETAPNPGTDPGTTPGTNPGTSPGTDPGTSPGTNPDPNANPNPGTPADPPPPDLSTQRFAVFARDPLNDGEDALQLLRQRLGQPAPAPSEPFDVPGHDGLSKPAPWTSSALLDALLADSLDRRDADAARPFTLDAPAGIKSPLVVLASPDAPGLSVAAAALTGHWRADAAGNRHVYALPAGLVRSSTPIASMTLRMADGAALPPGVRLDAARGLIVAPGLTQAQTLSLQLVVRAASGESRAIAITVSGDRLGLGRDDSAALATRDDAPAADKPALTQQLRHSAAQDVLAQARQFLASLDDDAAPAASDPAAAARQAAPIHAAS
ncbi:putative Ig domain-containing protein [Achromobacter sp. NFACC18-2]|uniref:putative Ig domain-containing protein n=1 Tax=Achromobacter sp. NFACC18-2 TaxID=1564112 RepID=UPI0008D4510E|nr:putative Ig domain-containing protein [Achromobacter sp. NFACC18-2]SEI60043.1 6-phosphogluconolactonase, cycloisomerase 2 family [Achromobacter sp. NFACC18-2]